jgi:hypothetical protein
LPMRVSAFVRGVLSRAIPAACDSGKTSGTALHAFPGQ